CSRAILTVHSPGEPQRAVPIVRYEISGSVPVPSEVVKTQDGSRIGYIFLPSFFDLTIPDQVKAALEKFGKLDGLIIDNRMNAGGSSKVLLPVLSYFTSGTLGTYTSSRGSRSLEIEADPVNNSQEVPIVVLVGKQTVSYGEIFAGILKDQ